MPLILAVDDRRLLPQATGIARSSREGILLLEEHRDRRIDELWLDYDLGGGDTIMPVVALLEQAAFDDRPFRIGAIFVHTSDMSAGETIVRALTVWNYRARRAIA